MLARAGLLDGHKATTHWAFVKCLQSFPKIEVDTTHARFVKSGNRLTGGGISSGLDEALELIALLFDEATAEAGAGHHAVFSAPSGDWQNSSHASLPGTMAIQATAPSRQF
ncbi:hypothetical protein [Mesorhizobium sangaii]|uniref:Transcriptional regulator GlxA family with amidase domain n=1 Tax=Mesorhizobium sangaii TaxID=505389 RepID=A0A841PBH3_9HYPH|nr:hypothetical protein [Mesorhizobium sangaii]MBB6410981.1 transcriptional regulator GlxA family with amidase domain [Mesorhizobium sangaii]